MAVDTLKFVKTFDNWAETYDSSIAKAEWGFDHYHEGINWICEQLYNKDKYTRIIDLGCGTAEIAKMLYRNNPSIEYIGIDFSCKMLNVAKSKYPNFLFINTDFRLFDEWSTYLDNEYNYAVVSSYSLHHINDKEKVNLINSIFSKSSEYNFVFLVVDYAFINTYERNHILKERLKFEHDHIKKEIETEYYADLTAIKKALRECSLNISFERNGIWDWRITLQR